MSDPRNNAIRASAAALANISWMQRLPWRFKAGTKYGAAELSAHMDAARIIADFQETETAQGRPLTIDGELGPNTARAAQAAQARAAAGAAAAGAFGLPGAAAAGAAGADRWGQWFSQHVEFGVRPTPSSLPRDPAPAPRPDPTPAPMPEVIIPEVVPDAPQGGDAGKVLGLIGLLGLAWWALG